VDGFLLYSDPFDGSGHTFWRTGLTEPETRELLIAILGPGMVMLDVGAYVGQFTLVASRAARGAMRVFAVEPTPTVFRQLRKNVHANKCINVTCIEAALSDRPGKATFYCFPRSHDQNSLRPLQSSTAHSIEVAVETVDGIAEQYHVDRIDLIKVDVEGNELAVLNGAKRVLQRFKPLVIVEVSRHQRSYGYTGAALKRLFHDLDYVTFRIQSPACVPYVPCDDEINEGVPNFNILAVSREHPFYGIVSRSC